MLSKFQYSWIFSTLPTGLAVNSTRLLTPRNPQQALIIQSQQRPSMTILKVILHMRIIISKRDWPKTIALQVIMEVRGDRASSVLAQHLLNLPVPLNRKQKSTILLPAIRLKLKRDPLKRLKKRLNFLLPLTKLYKQVICLRSWWF